MAAARAIANRKVRERRAKELEEAAKKQEEEDNSRIKVWFAAYDSNKSGQLERAQLKQLLSAKFPEHAPTDEVVDRVIKHAKRSMEREGKDVVCDENAVSGPAAIEAVAYYSRYLEMSTKIDGLFSKHDVSGSGTLERNELKTLMSELAPDIVVEDADLDFVIEKCDESGEGTINREEARAAIGTWKKIAKKKAAESQVCALL